MNSSRTIFNIFFFFLVATSLSRCCGCRNDTEIVPCITLVLDSLNLSAFDNSGEHPVASLNDTIPASALLLEMTCYGHETDTGTCYRPSSNWMDAFLATTMGFKCKSQRFNTPDSLDFIAIRTTNDFTSEYTAGIDLYHLFVEKSDMKPPGPGVYNSYWAGESVFSFYLFATPDSTRLQQFIVEFHFTDGRIKADTTEAFVLKK